MSLVLQWCARVRGACWGVAFLAVGLLHSASGQSLYITLGVNDRVGGGNLGQISLTADPDDQVISAGLPVTGLGNYRMPAAREGLPGGRRWVLVGHHGHDLEGALVRDLLRLCNGCPAF